MSCQDRQLRGFEVEDNVGRRDHETSHVKTAAEVIFFFWRPQNDHAFFHFMKPFLFQA